MSAWFQGPARFLKIGHSITHCPKINMNGKKPSSNSSSKSFLDTKTRNKKYSAIGHFSINLYGYAHLDLMSVGLWSF